MHCLTRQTQVRTHCKGRLYNMVPISAQDNKIIDKSTLAGSVACGLSKRAH